VTAHQFTRDCHVCPPPPHTHPHAHRTSSHQRYTPDDAGYNVSLGSIIVPAGGEVNITVPPLTIEFWLEY
jgi:hypothetical protein